MKMLTWLLVAAMIPATTLAAVPEELVADVGEADGAHLSMLFEVSMFKIDIANVDAFLPADAAAQIRSTIAGMKFNNEARAALEPILFTADPLLFQMTVKRDGAADRFVGGTKKNLEAAVEAELLTPAEFAAVWPQLEQGLAPLVERGMQKGDAIYYRVDGDQVRMVSVGVDGEIVFDFVREGQSHALGTRGMFFARKSAFSEKLMKSLFED